MTWAVKGRIFGKKSHRNQRGRSLEVPRVSHRFGSLNDLFLTSSEFPLTALRYLASPGYRCLDVFSLSSQRYLCFALCFFRFSFCPAARSRVVVAVGCLVGFSFSASRLALLRSRRAFRLVAASCGGCGSFRPLCSRFACSSVSPSVAAGRRGVVRAVFAARFPRPSWSPRPAAGPCGRCGCVGVGPCLPCALPF